MSKKYSKEEILSFLKTVSIMSASVGTADYPISTVLLFAVDDDFIFYFATRNDSYKAKALEKDSKMSVSVWKDDQMLVQAHGDVEKITNADEIDNTLNKLAESVASLADFWPPVLRLEGGDYCVYKLKTNWLRALDLTSKVIKEEDIPFTEFNL